MGNKLSRGGGADSKFTKPTGLYPSCEWDVKTVKKLINKKKIAPRYPGREEPGEDLDECPICFLWYPGGLNRSKCCRQPICTECFLQFKKPNSVKPVLCPFCNSLNYSVKYTGSLTKEEREALEQEEQKVIAAKIRMRKEEEARQVEREKELAIERERRAREGPSPEELAAAAEAERQANAMAARQQAAAASAADSSRSRRHYDRDADTDPRELRERERERRHRIDREGRHRHSDRDREAEGERDHRDRERDRHRHPQGNEDETGIHMDIEELMVMEAIRLSLLDNRQAQEAGDDQEVDEEDEEEEEEEEMEAGAPDRHAAFDSDDGEAGAGRRLSDDEEDWPATEWGDQRAPHMANPTMSSKTAAFDAALWRVNGEMAQDPLLLQLLHYACGWFDPDAEYYAPVEELGAAPVVMSQSPAVSSPPAAVEPIATLSTTSPAPPMPVPDEDVPELGVDESDTGANNDVESEEEQETELEVEPQNSMAEANEFSAGESDPGQGVADLTNETVPKMTSELSESPGWDKQDVAKAATFTNPFSEEELTNPFAEEVEEEQAVSGLPSAGRHDVHAALADDSEEVQLSSERKAQGWMEDSTSEVEPAVNDRGVTPIKGEVGSDDHLPPDEESVPDGPKKKHVFESLITSGEDDGISEEFVKSKLDDGTAVEDVDLIDLESETVPQKGGDAGSTMQGLSGNGDKSTASQAEETEAASKLQSMSRGMLARSSMKMGEEGMDGNGVGNGHSRQETLADGVETTVSD